MEGCVVDDNSACLSVAGQIIMKENADSGQQHPSLLQPLCVEKELWLMTMNKEVYIIPPSVRQVQRGGASLRSKSDFLLDKSDFLY